MDTERWHDINTALSILRAAATNEGQLFRPIDPLLELGELSQTRRRQALSDLRRLGFLTGDTRHSHGAAIRMGERMVSSAQFQELEATYPRIGTSEVPEWIDRLGIRNRESRWLFNLSTGALPVTLTPFREVSDNDPSLVAFGVSTLPGRPIPSELQSMLKNGRLGATTLQQLWANTRAMLAG